jgi:hypothetical protein
VSEEASESAMLDSSSRKTSTIVVLVTETRGFDTMPACTACQTFCRILFDVRVLPWLHFVLLNRCPKRSDQCEMDGSGVEIFRFCFRDVAIQNSAMSYGYHSNLFSAFVWVSTYIYILLASISIGMYLFG